MPRRQVNATNVGTILPLGTVVREEIMQSVTFLPQRTWRKQHLWNTFSVQFRDISFSRYVLYANKEAV